MNPREWRKSQNMTLAEVAGLINFGGPMNVHRYEVGKNRAPVDVIEEYSRISGGRVTAQDFHQVRIDYLRTPGQPGSPADRSTALAMEGVRP